MFSTNIFRYLDEPGHIFWPDHNPHVHHRRRDNMWSTLIPVLGYEPNEIAIKEEKDSNGDLKVVINAKHESEDEFFELRKSVKVPKEVDNENLRTIMSKDGVLILKAPYKHEDNMVAKPIKINREDTWNGIWGELGRLNDQMNQIIDGKELFTGTRTEYLASKDETDSGSGIWRLRMNVGKDFKPEEIKLRNHNSHVHVEGKKELKGNNSYSSKYFNEVISIPEGVEQDKLKSRLLNNGELVVEAPCNKMPALGHGDQGKDIPMEFNKSKDSDKMAIDN